MDDTNVCKCGGYIVFSDEGEFICDTCGVVSSESNKQKDGFCDCGGKLIVENFELVCEICSIVSKATLDDHVAHVQKSLDYNYTAEQYKNTLKSFLAMNASENPSICFSREILEDAVNFFFTIRGHINETRSLQLRAIYVMCIQRICTLNGQTQDIRTLKRYCKVAGANITPATILFQKLEQDGIIPKLDIDERASRVSSICNICGITDVVLISKVCGLAVYIFNILTVDIKMNNTPNSKIIAATYVSLRLHKSNICISEICKKNKIHEDTVSGVVSVIKYNNQKFKFDEYFEREDG